MTARKKSARTETTSGEVSIAHCTITGNASTLTTEAANAIARVADACAANARALQAAAESIKAVPGLNTGIQITQEKPW